MPVPEGQRQRVVRKIDFRVLPAPGTVLMHEGQRYVMVGSDLHVSREGKTVPIIFWQSHCAECGTPFQCSSGLKSGSLNRRCPVHHAPGKAVSGSGRKRVSRHLRKHGRRKKPRTEIRRRRPVPPSINRRRLPPEQPPEKETTHG